MTRLAIVGMSCILPGARSPEQFFENLLAGTDSRREGGRDEFGIDPDAPGGWGDDRHGINSRRGGFVADEPFDATGFRLPPAELASLDRSFRWPLHAARLALRDCGLEVGALDGERTGLVLGNYSFPTEASSRLVLPAWRSAVSLGLRRAGVLGGDPASAPPPDARPENLWAFGFPARVVGAALGLSGPQLALDAACSSVLYSLGLAAAYLETGRADLMLAGAVCAAAPTLIHLSFSDLGAYSAARSQPFDRRSSGIVTGQGAGIFAVKRLDDALAAGDRIHAVVDGIGLTNDGGGRHMLTPDVHGQLAAYEQAYAASGVAPGEIDYVECHATGTPLGDRTELDGLVAFFAAHGGRPRIGSVKANVGHLLTVAGFTSIAKVVLAMRHGTIPATPGVAEPLENLPPTALVGENQAWPDRGPLRRAAVSAFGFGGTNAHVVLSSAPAAAPFGAGAAPAAGGAPGRVAIAGIGCVVGPVEGRAAFERHVFAGEPALRALPARRWRGLDEATGVDRAALPDGAFCDEVAIDPLAHRVSPAEFENFNAQHALMLRVADEALADAGLAPAAPGPRRVAVVIAMEMEPYVHAHQARFDVGRHIREECARTGTHLDDETLERVEALVRTSVHADIGSNESLSWIGNIMASRISSRYDFTGPSFTVSADASGGCAALDVGMLLLRDASIDAVLVGGVDLSGDLFGYRARVAAGTEQRPLGEGAAALVLERAGDAPLDDRGYGTIEALAVAFADPFDGDRERSAHATGAAAAAALAHAGVDAEQVGHVELSAAAAGEAGSAEVAALAGVYGSAGDCVLGSLAGIVGDTQSVAPLLGVIKAALAVSLGTLPPATTGMAELAGIPSDAPFALAHGAQPWLRDRRERRRLAGVCVAGGGGTRAHAIVAGRRARPARRLERSDLRWAESGGELLLSIGGDDANDLLAAVGRMRERLAAASAPEAARLVADAVASHAPSALTAVLVAPDRDALVRELDAACRDLPGTLARGAEWATPAGSFCTPEPIGPDAKVAYVYPGAFSVYPDAGAGLFRAVPGLLDVYESAIAQPRRMFRADRLYARQLEPPTRRELMAREAEMLADMPSMLAAGTTFAVLHTRLLRDVLGVPVHGALGYSLGESSMLYALGVWRIEDADDEALRATPLFRDLLSGRKTAVRDAWGLANGTRDEDVWSVTMVLGDAARVREHVAARERVFVTHVNSPTESIVAGDPAACRAAIAELGLQSVRMPAQHVVHAPVVEPCADALAALNRCPARPSDVDVFSAYDYDVVRDFEPETLASRIAATLCTTVDFGRLVRAAYDRGHRCFVDVGPASTCTRWIGEIVGDRPHLAVALDRRGSSETAGIARALARLVSHGVAVDLAALAPASDGAAPGDRRYAIECGGASIAERVERSVAPLGVRVEPAGPVVAGAADAIASLARDDAAGEPEQLTFDGEPFYMPAAAEALLPAVVPPRVPVAAASATRNGGVPAAALASAIAAPLRERIRRTAERALHVHTELALQRLDRFEQRVAAGAGAPSRAGRDPRADRDPRVILDERDLLEFASGRLANVFGGAFAQVDTYPARVRLPEPPYLFVSRVTRLEAEPGRFEPSFIQTEYDVPEGAWYGVDGAVPPAVTIEAGQCDMLLISYLGIDLRTRGTRFYRLLDSTIVFHGDLPHAGQTLRYDISIDDFAWSGETLIFFFSYRCYADGRLIAELERASAGFFSQEELDGAAGALPAARLARTERRTPVAPFKPLARSARTSLGAEDLELLAAGDRAAVLGPDHGQAGFNPSLRLPGAQIRMIGEIVEIDVTGGADGLGRIVGRKRLEPDGWYFRCHFKDDPVLAGSMVAEGAFQLLQVYALHLGLHLCLPDARFQSVPGLRTEVKVRGQVTPRTPEIRYVVDVTEVTLLPRPTVIGDLTLYDGEKAIVRMDGFGIRIREKPGTPYRPGPGGTPGHAARLSSRGEPVLLSELHLAHAGQGDLGTAFGPEFDVYHDHRAPRLPNGAFQLVDRVVRIDGERGRLEPGATATLEYDSPGDAWYYEDHGSPGMPCGITMETSLQAAIFVGYYLGATLTEPEASFSVRNLDGRARLLRRVDLRGKTIRHDIRMLSNVSAFNNKLQSFAFELSVDGEPFYAGESMYGYYTEEGLARQVGLDAGEAVEPWIAGDGSGAAARSVVLDERPDLFARDAGLRLGDGRLRLLDSAVVVPGGGAHALGYVHARRRVDPSDWFFACHFHEDPVMPGSLGIETMVQALKLLTIEAGLAADVPEPCFAAPAGVEMGWKYRGQILPSDTELTLDVHVTEVREEEGGVVVVGDANLWKPGMRIYEATGIAIEVRPHGDGEGRA